MKKILKIFFLIIAIILLILVARLLYSKIMIERFSNLLSKNDSNNYELVQNDGNSIKTVKVRKDVLVSEDEDTCIWLSEKENSRVIMDKNSKIAIITENPEEKFKVGTLNSTYLSDYFENSNLKFKYLGKEDNYYKVQFTDKSTGTITTFYINKDTGVVEKLVENFNGTENIFKFEVTFDSVSVEDVEYPDLTEYEIGVSSSTVVSGDNENYEPEYGEEAEVSEN